MALRKCALCPGGGGYAPAQAGVMVMALQAGSAQLGVLLVGFEFYILGASRSTNGSCPAAAGFAYAPAPVCIICMYVNEEETRETRQGKLGVTCFLAFMFYRYR